MTTWKKILWNVVNCLLAGLIFSGGALTNGDISWKTVGVAIIIMVTVASIQFKTFWQTQEQDFTGSHLFQFI